MGSFSVLVIGDWREELEPFLDAKHIGNPFSLHIKCVDILNDELRKDYRQSQNTEKFRHQTSFSQWLHQQRGLKTLAADEKPDLTGIHRCGWVRLNRKGEVTEVILRNPGAPILYVSGEQNQFLLKPGARGWEVNDYEPEDFEITEGYASSARLCDIDFTTMRQMKVAQAPANWDWARRLAAGRTWAPFKDICKKYLVSASDKAEKEATHEWEQQPVIQELREYEYLRHSWPYELDALLLPRDNYVQHCAQYASVLDYGEVIFRGRFLGRPNENELLAGLDCNTRLTSIIVKQ